MIQAPGFWNTKYIVACTKMRDYQKDEEIAVSDGYMLLVAQDGREAGIAHGKRDGFNHVKINNKFFKGLKKGLFSNTYKNVVLYWYYKGSGTVAFNHTITTKRKRTGKVQGKLQYTPIGFKSDKFFQMLKSIKFVPDADKVVISDEVVREIINDRVLGAMPTALDNCPDCTFIAGKGNCPKEISTVESYVSHELEILGPIIGTSFKPLF